MLSSGQLSHGGSQLLQVFFSASWKSRAVVSSEWGVWRDWSFRVGVMFYVLLHLCSTYYGGRT